MKTDYKFDPLKLKGQLRKMRDWLNNHRFPALMVFVVMGIASTIWFLIRVIPKPSRAAYPCMRVAAPLMSGFVIYLVSVTGATLALKKANLHIRNSRYLYGFILVLAAFASSGIAIFYGSRDAAAIPPQSQMGPDDGPNMPMGIARGINPGRVVWIWNPEATNENCSNDISTGDYYFKPGNTDQKVVSEMIITAIKKLSGKKTIKESWDTFFGYHNKRKNNKESSYHRGEKIFIKINQGTSRWMLSEEDKKGGYYLPEGSVQLDNRIKMSLPATEANPYVVLEILRQLIDEAGIEQSDITVGDPMTHIYGHNYDIWHSEYPNVIYIDKFTEAFGRKMIRNTEKDLLFYADKKQTDKLYDVVGEADYLINLAHLKPHVAAGISLTAKNHFGTQGRATASHLHYALMNPRGGIATNGGYKKYRVLVDLMGSKYLGQNTVLYFVDGLFGGGGSETRPPVKYFMEPFNNDWSNSIFLSLDQVALESVCYDFLRTEWNGINKHNPANNAPEISPSYKGVDDYLHQAADPANWPEGIKYDPDGSGTPIISLGTHEHWNNSQLKQYSGNLGSGTGIELIAVPESLVGTTGKPIDISGEVSVKNQSVEMAETNPTSRSKNALTFGPEVNAKKFSAVVVDNTNRKWFISETGIVSYDNKKWTLHNKNRKVTSSEFRGMAFEVSSYGPEVWLATVKGATVASLPIDARTGATTYFTENAAIGSNNVKAIAIGKSPLRWIGTDKGIAAFDNRKWLKPSYETTYPESIFEFCPITSMATSPGGDTLYVGTEGAGVARVFKNTKVDAISGASEYAQWGTILIPSDSVYSIFIDPKGDQWIGTNRGAALHKGSNTLGNWKVFDVASGLIDNFVQAITMDNSGKVWFGTKNGISVLNGSSITSYTEKDGLVSNNVLCLTTDRDGIVWIGTDIGVSSFKDGVFTSFRASN